MVTQKHMVANFIHMVGHHAAKVHKNNCLENVDLGKLLEHALLILNSEEMLFKNLLKLKV